MRTLPALALLCLAGCFAPGVYVEVAKEAYEVVACTIESPGFNCSLEKWTDYGSAVAEVDWCWRVKKDDRYYAGFRLRNYEGFAEIDSGTGYPSGPVSGQEWDLVIFRREWAKETSHSSVSTGLRYMDVPGYDGSLVETQESFALFGAFSATGLLPLGRSGVSLGAGIDGRFDYVAAIAGGYHDELALNGRRGSRATRGTGGRSVYAALGYRTLWTNNFATADYMPEGYTLMQVDVTTSGLYVATTLWW